jgi:UPF0716 protein FxsA
MPLVKWSFIGLLLLPAAEFGAFLLMVLAIGWLWTVALFTTTSLIGWILLRRTGRDQLDRFRTAVSKDGIHAIHLDSPGLAAITGGILLLLPGFITDLVGALLFIAPLRRWAGATIGRAMRNRRRKTERVVIDLEPGQWHQVSSESLEDRREDRTKNRTEDRTDDRHASKRRR